jgi:hypothetical protein
VIDQHSAIMSIEQHVDVYDDNLAVVLTGFDWDFAPDRCAGPALLDPTLQRLCLREHERRIDFSVELPRREDLARFRHL